MTETNAELAENITATADAAERTGGNVYLSVDRQLLLRLAAQRLEARDDMAAVGEALMGALDSCKNHPALDGWHPAQCPSEIITDLLNQLDDANKRLEAREISEAERIELQELRKFRDSFNSAFDDNLKLAESIVRPHLTAAAVFGVLPDHRFRETTRPADLVADLASALSARAALEAAQE